ncbi:MAG: sugar phosphate isomerase/epimerase family protein [Aristaeellaceae bacterium]
MYFNRPGGVKADIRDSVRTLGQAGYRVLDMNFHDLSMFDTPFHTDEWEAVIRECGDIAREMGIVFSQGHSHFYNFCNPCEPDREHKDELIRRGIVGAHILGIPWLVIHAATDFDSQTPLRDSKRGTIEYLKPRLELAERLGVGIALENLWEENIAPKRRYCTTAEELVDLVDTLREDFGNVGCCWDVEHGAICGIDHRKALPYVGERLKATHISDYNSIRNDHILPYGGLADWDEITEGLRLAGYAGDFTYECHNHTAKLPDAAIPTALRHSIAVGEYLISLIQQP